VNFTLINYRKASDYAFHFFSALGGSSKKSFVFLLKPSLVRRAFLIFLRRFSEAILKT
jgi:hypothetical protein